ncbi:uncharacterized protein [Amphiura filiformis]|uniref:uncharacterized protein n=1 Tax=Amphiura filiformis TaxID=82378 RepID=UPI003B221359
MFCEIKLLRLILTLCFISISVLSCNCECPNPIPVWEAIPENQYDRNASSVKPGMRPLGFYYTILPYRPTPDGDPNPCFKVERTADKRVEIMTETYGSPNSKLCVRTQLQDLGCNDGKIYTCAQANANSLTIEFYCDTNGCDESDVPIWVRFVVSYDEFDDDPELFCMERDPGEYPSSLMQLPNLPLTLQPNPPTLQPNSTASKSSNTPIIVSKAYPGQTTASGSTFTVTLSLLILTSFLSFLFKFVKI